MNDTTTLVVDDIDTTDSTGEIDTTGDGSGSTSSGDDMSTSSTTSTGDDSTSSGTTEIGSSTSATTSTSSTSTTSETTGDSTGDDTTTTGDTTSTTDDTSSSSTGGVEYDFSQVFCAGTCSYAGSPGCDQADADVLCRLRTGDPLSTATSFTLGVPTDDGGVACSNPDQPVVLNGIDPRVSLGAMPELLGIDIEVLYVPSMLAASHGGGPTSTIINVECT